MALPDDVFATLWPLWLSLLIFALAWVAWWLSTDAEDDA
jgi:hypothetical protein